jgi:hypothetical protein
VAEHFTASSATRSMATASEAERPPKRDRSPTMLADFSRSSPLARVRAAGLKAPSADEHPAVALFRACELARVRVRAAELVETMLGVSSGSGLRGCIDERRTKSGKAAMQVGVAMGIQGMLARSQLKMLGAEQGNFEVEEDIALHSVDPVLPCSGVADVSLAKELKKLGRDLSREAAFATAEAIAKLFQEASGRVQARSKQEFSPAELSWTSPAPPASGFGSGEQWGVLQFTPQAGSEEAVLLKDCACPDGRWMGSFLRSCRGGYAHARFRSDDQLLDELLQTNPLVGFGPFSDSGNGVHAAYRVRVDAMEKLLALYRLHSDSHAVMTDEVFIARAFAVICRYECLARTTSGSQGAVTHAVFDWLHSSLGADVECFASPLNCYFPMYCSAFPDTDGWFGSIGSFFHVPLAAIGGVFECNPPFTSDLMLGCVRKLVRECSIEPATTDLTVVLYTPAWHDDLYVKEARASPHCVLDVVVRRDDHEYRDGMQHASVRAVWSANVDSLVFVFQNSKARESMPIAEDARKKLALREGLLEAMRRRELPSSPMLSPDVMALCSSAASAPVSAAPSSS